MDDGPETPYEISAEPGVDSSGFELGDPPPPPTRVDSAASYESLDRHRRRNPRTRRPVKVGVAGFLMRDRLGETDHVVRKRWTLAPNIRQVKMMVQPNTISINTSSSKRLDEDPLARSIWQLTNEPDERFTDLMSRLLEKDPAKRIDMHGLREHPWVTMNGADPLLSEEENTAHNVEPPTEEEMNAAITKSIGHVMTLMKAVKNFKRLVEPNKADPAMQSILGADHEAHFVEPPMEMDPDDEFPVVGLDESVGTGHGSGGGVRKVFGRHPMLAGQDRRDNSWNSDSASSSRLGQSPVGSKRPSGVFEPERKDSGSIRTGRSPASFGHEARQSQSGSPMPLSRASSATTKRSVEGTRGHARDPLEEEFPYLHIGPSTYTGSSQEPTDLNIGSDPAPLVAGPDSMENDLDPDSVGPVHFVSESPGAAEFDIYDTAYRQELERINANSSQTFPGVGPRVYLTRRIENKDEVMNFAKEKAIDLQTGTKKFVSSPVAKGPSSTFSAAVSLLRNQIEQQKDADSMGIPQQQEQEQMTEPPTERRGSNPPSSSIQPQSLPDPEASSFEATGVPIPEPPTSEDSKAQLRRLLARARDKGGE
ncbi:Calcium/calmodulin-dependent protein kinase kinase cmkC [Penicillium frequentans]|nr:Calcium/calmodulin-dependent protein kinase kinase cmkC [Penicillium glabrum]